MLATNSSRTIQLRVDAQTKEDAESVFQDLGINMSQAIKLFLKQVSLKKAIPFSVTLTSSIPYVDEKVENEIGQAYADYKQGRFTSINSDKDIDKLFTNQ